MSQPGVENKDQENFTGMLRYLAKEILGD